MGILDKIADIEKEIVEKSFIVTLLPVLIEKQTFTSN